MEGKVKYPKTSRDDCTCNLCQKIVTKLSDDHIPPKGWMKPDKTIVECYPEGSSDDTFRSTKKANGLTFKTICASCNNMLGSQYDKALKAFAKSIASVYESPDNTFKSFPIETQPSLVVKAVLGHMLAAKTGFCDTSIDKEIRRYVMNPGTKLSSKIKLYYWFYPSDTAIISLDKAPCDLQTGSHAFFSVMKYYPVAFMMMYESEMVDKSICELTRYIMKNENERVRVPFKLNEMPINFPESIKYSQCCLVPDDHTDLIAHK